MMSEKIRYVVFDDVSPRIHDLATSDMLVDEHAFCDELNALAARVATLTAELARVTAERDSAIREWGWASGERDNAADSYVFLTRVIEAIESGSVMVAALTGEKNRWVGWRGGNPKHFATAGEAYRWSDELDPEGGPTCTPNPTS
jgi:hypothetical protein